MPFGTGAEAYVGLQAPDRLGVRSRLDPQKTNLFAGTVSESSADCIPCPLIMGGLTLYELAIELFPDWDPAGYDPNVVPPSALPATPGLVQGDPEYCRKYVVGGDQFGGYMNVGRLWSANTDNHRPDVGGEPASSSDLAALCGWPEGSWPEACWYPMPLLSPYLAADMPSAHAEISWDNGATWYPINAGHETREEDLVCWIGESDLRSVRVTLPPEYPPPVPIVPERDNLWVRLAGTAPNPIPRLRLVCVIPSPYRNSSVSPRQPTAGTVFPQTSFLDRGTNYQIRNRTASSPYYGGGAPAPARPTARCW